MTSIAETQPYNPQVKQHSTWTRAVAKDIVVMSNDAVFSGAWSWPIKGLFYIFSHPSLLSPIKALIIKSTIFTLAITTILFVVGYFPTVAVLAFSNGILAFAAAIPLILGVGSAIGLSISRIFWLSTAQEYLFDEVLVQEGLGTLVSRGRQVRRSDSHTGSKIGKVLTKPLNRFTKEAMIRWLISLPLNAIPVVGPTVFFLYNGAKAGPSYHQRYFQLKAMAASPEAARTPEPFESHGQGPDSAGSSGGEGVTRRKERGEGARDAPPYEPPMSSRSFDKGAWVKAHRGAYAGFGTMAIALDLIPGAAVVCMLGNVVGAALWASQIEKEGEVERDGKAEDARTKGVLKKTE